MPFEKEPLGLSTSIPTNKLPTDPQGGLGFTEVIGDAFHIHNPVVAIGKFMEKDKELDPDTDFNVVERAEEDGLNIDTLNSLLFVDSEEEYRKAVNEIDIDLKAKERLGSAGVSGMLATMTAALASPSTFMGGGALVATLKAGKSVAKTAAITSSVVGATVLAEEKLLQATQAGRTDEEVAINTAAAFVLSGLISGGAVKLSNIKAAKAASQLKANMSAQMQVGKPPELLGEFAAFDDSIGAAKTPQEVLFESEGLSALSKEQLGIAKSNSKLMQPVLDGYAKMNKVWNPAVRMMSSAAKGPREFFLNVADTSLKPQAVKEGFAIEESLEGILKRRQGDYTKEVVNFKDTYKDFKKAGGNLGWGKFREEVGKAVRSDVPHSNPQVVKAATQFKNYYEDLAQELIDAKLMPEDILTAKAGARYLNRIYNTKRIEKDLPSFKKAVEPYMRKQLTKIKNKLLVKIDEVENGKPTKEALDAREEFRKFFDEDEFESYLKDSIQSITNNIIKADSGIGFSPVRAGTKGPMKKRSFNIPDKDIEGFLNNDILTLSDRYTRQVVPEIEIKKKFGDTTFDDMVKDTVKEYDELIEKTPSKTEKLIAERREVLRDMDTTWNLLRGTYKATGGGADAKLRRASEAVLTHNYMASLGGVLISSVPDAGMGILRRGFSNMFSKSLKPFIKDMVKTGGQLSKTEARSYGQALEFANSSRTQALVGIGDPMAFGGTPFERYLNWSGNKMSNINLINQWNDNWQTVATLGVRFRAVENISDFIKKGKLGRREEEWMNFIGIGKGARKSMAEQIELHGSKGPNGEIIPNVDRWLNKDLANKFITGISKEIDRTVITKGVTDIPIFGNTGLGRIIFQWQNFNFAFNNKVILSSMQEADGRTLTGLGSLMTMGMMTDYLKSLGSGQPLPENPAQWIDAGLDRSGILGMLAYGNSYAETMGVSYKQLLGEKAPRAGLKGLASTVLGPTGRTIQQAEGTAEALIKRAGGKEFTQKDVHRLRSMAWGQNVFYLKPLFDELEEVVGKDLPKGRKTKRRNK